MRVIAEIPHPEFKISVFSWNGKFIVKIEAGIYEQAFRISEDIVEGDIEKIKVLIDEELIASCRARFLSMRDDLSKSFKKIKQHQI